MRLKTILLLMLCCMGTAAQTAYKGQLHVSDERFSMQGQLLRVYMKVSYDSNALNTGETLLFTPVLKSQNHYVRMTTVAINGDSRERYERRTDKLRQRRRINIPVVTRDAPRSGPVVRSSKLKSRSANFIPPRPANVTRPVRRSRLTLSSALLTVRAVADDCRFSCSPSCGRAVTTRLGRLRLRPAGTLVIWTVRGVMNSMPITWLPTVSSSAAEAMATAARTVSISSRLMLLK